MSKDPLKTLLTLLLLTTLGCAPAQKAPLGTLSTADPGEPAQEVTPVPTPSGTEDRPLTLAFVGDIMMAGSAANKLKTQGADSFFTRTADLLTEADIAVGNLEGPLGLTGKVWIKKQYSFLVDPSAAGGLARAGFDVMTLANNHTMDYGPDALRTTLQALQEEGLAHAGAGMNLTQARGPAWIERNGWKVAFFSYSKTYPTEFWAGDTRPGCAPADGHMIREDIQAARSRGADLVFILCHWGQEKKTKLRGYQPDLAELAIEAGADGVIGHHPHIWQSLDVHRGKPVAYSVGNFAFGSLSASTTESGILFLTYDRDRRWSGGWIVPLDVNNHRVSFCPTPMKEAAAGKFYKYLAGLSKRAALSLEGTVIRWKAPAARPSVSSEEPVQTQGSLPGTSQP